MGKKHNAIYTLTVTLKKNNTTIIFSFLDEADMDKTYWEVRDRKDVVAVKRDLHGIKVHNGADVHSTLNLMSL